MPVLDVKSTTRALVNTRFAGNIHHSEVTDSTNHTAVKAACAADPAPDGTVFVADQQTAGRGRGGHTWHSAPGDGLYVSAVVRPKIALAEALWISLATGLAAQRAIHESAGLHADIRWPNDLLIGPKKCGGILVETANHPSGKAGTPAQLRYAVIGVGLNVNHKSFPIDLAASATSLHLETNSHTPRETLLINFLLALDAEINLLEAELHGSHAHPPLLERFAKASSWVHGKRVHVDEDGGYTGKTAGLDKHGFLLVHGDDGLTRTVLSGGVRPA